MIVFITEIPDSDDLQIVVSAVDGDTVGESIRVIGPDGEFLGWSQSELKDLGEGKHDIEEKSNLVADLLGSAMDAKDLKELVNSL